MNYLNSDGDFRSKETIELLKQADIVVTNPPFSLFREYVAQLIEYKKKFSWNAFTQSIEEIYSSLKNETLDLLTAHNLI